MFAATFAYMSIWSYTSEVAAKRLRETYLASILRQDIAFFDNVGAGEVTTRIETDTREHLRSSCYPLVFTPYFQISFSKVSLRRSRWRSVSSVLFSSVSSLHFPSNGSSPWPCPR